MYNFVEMKQSPPLSMIVCHQRSTLLISDSYKKWCLTGKVFLTFFEIFWSLKNAKIVIATRRNGSQRNLRFFARPFLLIVV